MFKKTLLATTIVAFTSTTAFAEGGNTTPRMTAEEIATYSTQSAEEVALSAGAVLPVFLAFLMICAVACGRGGGNPYYMMLPSPE